MRPEHYKSFAPRTRQELLRSENIDSAHLLARGSARCADCVSLSQGGADKMRRISLIVLWAVFIVGGCASKTAWDHYDACAVKTASCGKQERTAYCQEHRTCSAEGNNVVAYADSLVVSVHNGEMSEAEANENGSSFGRRWQVERRQLTQRRAGPYKPCAEIISSTVSAAL